MSPGEYQQKLKDELRERFVQGPHPSRLPALLSAADLHCNELRGKLILARDRIEKLERQLESSDEKLAEARRILAEIDPSTYWQKCAELAA
jgi:hypothetical protein